MKSISIARLKHFSESARYSDTQSEPEMKSLSIARLKRKSDNVFRRSRSTWYEKHLDCEIETGNRQLKCRRFTLTWYEKHLDCEIETKRHQILIIYSSGLKWKASRLRDWNQSADAGAVLDRLPEMKSISIARLKREWKRPTLYSICPDMKSISIARLKRRTTDGIGRRCKPDMKSISIARLKPPYVRCGIKSSVPDMKSISITRLKRHPRIIDRNSVSAWNEKHLDYEIETFYILLKSVTSSYTWNEKHLDYEIETSSFLVCLLKKTA